MTSIKTIHSFRYIHAACKPSGYMYKTTHECGILATCEECMNLILRF